MPGGGIDQTATLQEAADAAAKSGTPLFLPAGVYATSRLTLKSGTHVQGVAGNSILRYRDGGAILNVDTADDVRLDGLVLDGAGKAFGDGGALLVATASKHSDVSNCRFLSSGADGVVLRGVAGRISDCEIGDIAKGGLLSEDAAGLEITHRIERIAAKRGGSGQKWRERVSRRRSAGER